MRRAVEFNRRTPWARSTSAGTSERIEKGEVTFSTICPGWYHGRTVHIHFKIRSAPSAKSQSYELTSQLFFDDALSDAVLARAPYNTRGIRRVRNASDGIYRSGGGSQLLLNVEPASSGKGYRATFNIGLLT